MFMFTCLLHISYGNYEADQIKLNSEHVLFGILGATGLKLKKNFFYFKHDKRMRVQQQTTTYNKKHTTVRIIHVVLECRCAVI